MSRYGAPIFSSLLNSCILWAPLQHSAGVSGDIDEFPILPSGVTVTNNGTFTKTDLGNNKSVLNFDGGVNNSIYLNNLITYFAFETDPFTIAFWIRMISGSGPFCILSKYTTWATDLDLYISYDSSTQYFSCYVLPSTTSPNLIMTTTQSPITDWTFVVFTKETGGVYKSYLNGVYQSSITNATAQTNNKSQFIIGSNTGAFIRAMKDLMIWKGRALTQPEIKLLMNRTHPITGTGLMPANGDYWRIS